MISVEVGSLGEPSHLWAISIQQGERYGEHFLYTLFTFTLRPSDFAGPVNLTQGSFIMSVGICMFVYVCIV